VRPPIILTLGGGGAYALGFHLGIVEGLRREHVDVTNIPVMGTSGGSHAAIALAGGMSFDEIVPIWQRYVDDTGSFWVRASTLTEELYGTTQIPAEWPAAGVAVRFLGFKRVVLWAADHRPADIVAASSSPFPTARPHKVGKRRYIDGGHRSGTSADLAIDADLQIVLAPFMEKAQGFVGRLGARQVRKEPPKWRARTGGETIVIGPSEPMIGLKISGMRDFGDTAIGRQVFDLAIPLGEQLAGTLRAAHPEVLARL
jgi:predicted acylesterase/phospholipase RssA